MFAANTVFQRESYKVYKVSNEDSVSLLLMLIIQIIIYSFNAFTLYQYGKIELIKILEGNIIGKLIYLFLLEDTIIQGKIVNHLKYQKIIYDILNLDMLEA